MKLGFIGLGNIASAVATGVARDGHQIYVSQRGAAHAAKLDDQFDAVAIADNQTVLDNSDVVFLGTTAEAAPEVLKPLEFRPDQKVISFMVGISTKDIQSLIAPAQFEAIMIPYPSIAEGGSPLMAYPQSDTIDSLVGKTNTVVSLSTEAALSDFLAAQAILSPIVKMLATGADWLAAKTGDYHGAEQFLRLLVGGSLLAKPTSERDVLPALIAALNTPGGLNRQFREFMEAEGAFASTERGLDALSKRLSEAS